MRLHFRGTFLDDSNIKICFRSPWCGSVLPLSWQSNFLSPIGWAPDVDENSVGEEAPIKISALSCFPSHPGIADPEKNRAAELPSEAALEVYGCVRVSPQSARSFAVLARHSYCDSMWLSYHTIRFPKVTAGGLVTHLLPNFELGNLVHAQHGDPHPKGVWVVQDCA